MKFLLPLLFLFCFIKANSQIDTTEATYRYYDDFIRKNLPNYSDIFYGTSRGGSMIESYRYYEIQNGYIILYRNYINNVFKTKTINSDSLYHLLDDKSKDINYIKLHSINKEDFLKKYNDSIYPMKQIAIWYKDIKYNHFIPQTEIAINVKNNTQYINGQKVINHIASFFERILNN